MSDTAITAFPLRTGRVHEAGGPLAAGFAAACIAQVEGTVLWIRESWRSDLPHPEGLTGFFDPARLLLAQVRHQTDALAIAEEALRDGVVPLVVTELTSPIDLTEGRRLQLAARAGQSIGLCLIAEGAGSNAAETRWHCSALPDADGDTENSTLQCWKLIKNKSGTLGNWYVRWDRTARRLALVSPARE